MRKLLLVIAIVLLIIALTGSERIGRIIDNVLSGAERASETAAGIERPRAFVPGERVMMQPGQTVSGLLTGPTEFLIPLCHRLDFLPVSRIAHQDAPYNQYTTLRPLSGSVEITVMAVRVPNCP